MEAVASLQNIPHHRISKLRPPGSLSAGLMYSVTADNGGGGSHGVVPPRGTAARRTERDAPPCRCQSTAGLATTTGAAAAAAVQRPSPSTAYSQRQDPAPVRQAHGHLQVISRRASLDL